MTFVVTLAVSWGFKVRTSHISDQEYKCAHTVLVLVIDPCVFTIVIEIHGNHHHSVSILIEIMSSCFNADFFVLQNEIIKLNI